MRRCSSDSCSGVKTDSTAVSSISHEPPRTVVSVVIAHLHAFEDSSGAHAAAHAHRDQAVTRLSPPHFVEKRRRQLGAGAAERVAERDGAAVDVQSLRIDWQLAQAGNHLCGKRLVQLDQIHLLERQSGELQHFSNCRHRPDAKPLRFDTGGRERHESPERLEAQLARRVSDITSTAAAPSLVCDELPAVTVPLT